MWFISNSLWAYDLIILVKLFYNDFMSPLWHFLCCFQSITRRFSYDWSLSFFYLYIADVSWSWRCCLWRYIFLNKIIYVEFLLFNSPMGMMQQHYRWCTLMFVELLILFHHLQELNLVGRCWVEGLFVTSLFLYESDRVY